MFTGSLDAAERRLELLVGAALRLRLVVLTTLTRILHVSVPAGGFAVATCLALATAYRGLYAANTSAAA